MLLQGGGGGAGGQPAVELMLLQGGGGGAGGQPAGEDGHTRRTNTGKIKYHDIFIQVV